MDIKEFRAESRKISGSGSTTPFIKVDKEKSVFILPDGTETDTITAIPIDSRRSLRKFNDMREAIIRTTDVKHKSHFASCFVTGLVTTAEEFKRRYEGTRTNENIYILTTSGITTLPVSGYSLNPNNPNSWYTFRNELKDGHGCEKINEAVVHFRLLKGEYDGREFTYVSFTFAKLVDAEMFPKILDAEKRLKEQYDSQQNYMKDELGGEVAVTRDITKNEAPKPQTETINDPNDPRGKYNPDDIPF